jgi:5-methylcytosine-specific restriction protein A
MFQRPCLVQGCPGMSKPGQSRCQPHLSQVNKSKHQRRATVAGDGAASRVRRNINRAGAAHCHHCAVYYPAHRLEVDHIVALIDNGTDYADNIQVLCHACHVTKTTTEARARRIV